MKISTLLLTKFYMENVDLKKMLFMLTCKGLIIVFKWINKYFFLILISSTVNVDKYNSYKQKLVGVL